MSADEIKKLKYKRGSIKGKLSRLQHYFESIDVDNLTEQIVYQLKIRLEKTSGIVSEFANVSNDINYLEENEDYKDVEEFEKCFYDVTANINKVITDFSLNNSMHTPSSLQEASSDNQVSSVNSGNLISGVKLPTINLPTFKGQYNCWLEFRDAFKSLIHDNSALSSVQKFYYLRSCVQEDAACTIDSIEVTANNYNIAWQLLQDRFENKSLIVHNHVKAIFEQPQISKESHTQLRGLYDSTTKNLRALKSLGESTDSWDTLIVYILATKMDDATRREWEIYNNKSESVKMTDMNKFLKDRCDLLERLEQDKIKIVQKSTGNKQFKSNTYTAISDSKLSCYYCKKEHTIYNCDEFKSLSINDRITEVKKLNLCLNCLRVGHNVKNCQSMGCRKCKRRHNTLLHITHDVSNASPCVVNEGSSEPAVTISNHSVAGECTQVCLSTVLVHAEDVQGNKHTLRALLDNGSQSSFVTEKAMKILRIKRYRTTFRISSVGQTATNVHFQAHLNLSSIHGAFKVGVPCLVLEKITEPIPSISMLNTNFTIPSHVVLADPTFNITNDIDILLGADIFWKALLPNRIPCGKNGPVLQNTTFGWIVTGKFACEPSAQSINCLAINKADQFIKRFWEIEELGESHYKFDEKEQFCENHFRDNFERDSSGRFIVRIPFNDQRDQLGDSREMALNRFKSLEKRLTKNNNLRQGYNEFMKEYISLGHMKQVDDVGDNHSNYFLPHHAIFKDTSLTTKIRVVFDASAKTSTGLSLNDVQYSGPTIQNDLFSILVRFRLHTYVLTADISKMYRQVLIHPDECCMQKIFWRFCEQEPLSIYELGTVTYGTASAPFSSVRCLKQLAIEHAQEYPEVSKIIENDFYVDDVITGASTEADLLRIQRELVTVLSRGKFELRKWLCNSQDILSNFQVDENLNVGVLNLSPNENNKTLGIFWNAHNDTIQYSGTLIPRSPGYVTKRAILSIIGQIFDPLGLIAPITISGKIIIQKLWLQGLDWDEPVKDSLLELWSEFLNNIEGLNMLRIPRHILQPGYEYCELHGFADASESAYGACVYLRSKVNEKWKIQLVCSKSKVSPIKQVTLPRLELCAATLLAKLTEKVRSIIHIKLQNQYFWSDSTIALCWIRGCPTRWKTFVANRVGIIQSLTKKHQWNHVRSRSNPADLLTRGITSENLKDSTIWFYGPSWLSEDTANWPKSNLSEVDTIPEQRTVTLQSLIIDESIYNRFSSLLKLKRVVAYVLRFASNCKGDRVIGALTSRELTNAMNVLLRTMQQNTFSKEYSELSSDRPLSKKSSILSLNPFLDENKIIRVGGRLVHGKYNFDKTHPVVLPKDHYLTKLILMHEHIRLLHCGPQQLLYSIREQYWPLSGRTVCRGITRKCIICFRVKPMATEYLMGNLPKSRITPFIPFLNVGLDYAGPFLLKDRSTRGAKIIKAYVCVFVCMASKAIHLELLMSLSTEAFLSMFKRFLSRRGLPANVYSDNATTFVGANADLKALFSFVNSESLNIKTALSKDNISWHFIPARSPTFGGIWEAGVKSFKYHLRRVLGEARVTFEEFYTVISQIEAILNSRPISPMSSSPDDLSPLTPGHLLIGKSLTSIPESNLTDIPTNRLNNYQRLEQLKQHFWCRWQKEYISELQARLKWKKSSQSLIKPGQLVLIKEDQLPPLQWKLGRIVELHPGQDGVVRVVSIKGPTSVMKRSVTRICVLPVEETVKD